MARESGYRGTARTLAVLRALNASNGLSVLQLSRETEISRAALYRILTELQRAGYIRRTAEDGAIYLTSLIQTLSTGYRDEIWIREIAGPVLDDLQQRVVWPTDLGILHNYQIRLLMTTRAHSPLVIDRGFAGIDMPIFATSLGQAYIAFSAPTERKAIIDYLSGDPTSVDGALLQNKTQIARLLQGVRSNGYAARFRNGYNETRYPGIIKDTAALAVPIRRGRFSVASLGITFIASALSVKQAVEKHLQDMQDAASRIEEMLMKASRQQQIEG
ncbi:MAG: transcriptional regulator [Hyphomicrobiales bacterium]|nr:transcriptional regulator [Hyphomicrobiales bacterium]